LEHDLVMTKQDPAHTAVRRTTNGWVIWISFLHIVEATCRHGIRALSTTAGGLSVFDTAECSDFEGEKGKPINESPTRVVIDRDTLIFSCLQFILL